MNKIDVLDVSFELDLEDVDLEGMAEVSNGIDALSGGDFASGFNLLENGLKKVIGEDVYAEIFSKTKKSTKNYMQIINALKR